MIDLCLSLLLHGHVSNEYGRIGVRVNMSGGVSKVYRHSPAYEAGIRPGDIILEADHHKGAKFVDGEAYTVVNLKTKRLGELNIERVPKGEVYD